jgi:hypothetical protein
MIDDFDRARAHEAAHRLRREAEIWRLERAMQENPEDPGTDACDICHLYIMPGDFYVESDVQGLVCCGCADLNVGDNFVVSRMRVHRQADDTYDPDWEPPF